MILTSLETVRLAEWPNIIWLRLHTQEGLVGLGETFQGAAAVEAYLHEQAAPLLLGQDPSRIEAIAARLRGHLGSRGSGVETRGNSAVDIALWDLMGKRLGCPLHDLLGGRFRNEIRAYNTCAGPNYARAAKPFGSANFGLGYEAERHEDLTAFLNHPEDLAHSLLDQGIGAMKIWPFDRFAEASGGLSISADEMRLALEPFARIRKEVGDKMDIMAEFHALWNLPAAVRIARALEPYEPFWHEDPIRTDSLSSLAHYAQATAAPVCASETFGSRWAFRDLIEAGVRGVVMMDLSWCGGVSEAHKIASLADTWDLPVTAHDCTGPVVLAASIHLALAAPNALIQEMVRAFYFGWYQDLVTALPSLTKGFLTPPPGPGLGLELLPDLTSRPDAIVRISRPD